jgi:flagellar hook-associated protein 1 FlgK
MGTGALTSLGIRAMTASYAQLQTTSNNIANVNTQGYSRQEVQLATAGGQFTGAGFFGRNSGTFQRGVGQTGEVNVKLTVQMDIIKINIAVNNVNDVV